MVKLGLMMLLALSGRRTLCSHSPKGYGSSTRLLSSSSSSALAISSSQPQTHSCRLPSEPSPDAPVLRAPLPGKAANAIAMEGNPKPLLPKGRRRNPGKPLIEQEMEVSWTDLSSSSPLLSMTASVNTGAAMPATVAPADAAVEDVAEQVAIAAAVEANPNFAVRKGRSPRKSHTKQGAVFLKDFSLSSSVSMVSVDAEVAMSAIQDSPLPGQAALAAVLEGNHKLSCRKGRNPRKSCIEQEAVSSKDLSSSPLSVNMDSVDAEAAMVTIIPSTDVSAQDSPLPRQSTIASVTGGNPKPSGGKGWNPRKSCIKEEEASLFKLSSSSTRLGSVDTESATSVAMATFTEGNPKPLSRKGRNPSKSHMEEEEEALSINLQSPSSSSLLMRSPPARLGSVSSKEVMPVDIATVAGGNPKPLSRKGQNSRKSRKEKDEEALSINLLSSSSSSSSSSLPSSARLGSVNAETATPAAIATIAEGNSMPLQRKGRGPRKSRMEEEAAFLEGLTSLGIGKEQAQRILVRRGPFGEWRPKAELLIQRGCSVPQLGGFLEKGACALGSCRKLAEVLDFLETVFLSAGTALEMLARSPLFLKLGVSTMQCRASFLRSQGFDAHKLSAVLQRHPRLLGFSSEALQERMSFLETLGLGKEGILKMLHRCPDLFLRSVENTLKPFFDSLEARGFVKEVAMRWMVNRPHAVQLSLAAISERLALLRELGFKENSIQMTKGYFVFSTYRRQLIQERILWFIAQGLSGEEVKSMIRVNPRVLTTPPEKVTLILNYVDEYLNCDLKALARISVVFHLSPENRILPRCKLVADLRDKGILTEPVSLGLTFLSTDKAFEKYITSKTRREEAVSRRRPATVDTEGLECVNANVFKCV